MELLKIEDELERSFYEKQSVLENWSVRELKLSHAIVLDESETEVAPQNPNPRSAHNTEEEQGPLGLIIQSFNDRWFHGWEATPEEQRVKFVTIARHVHEHPNFQRQYVDNPDTQNRELALMKMVDDAIRKQRRTELEMYKLYSQDQAFQQALRDVVRRMVGR